LYSFQQFNEFLRFQRNLAPNFLQQWLSSETGVAQAKKRHDLWKRENDNVN